MDDKEAEREAKKEAFLQKMEQRHQQTLAKAEARAASSKKINLKATKKAFLETSPSKVNMSTPLNPSIAPVGSNDSPILTFDEEANKQMVALATWCNTMIGLDNSEELNLGATKAEACKHIHKMLASKKKEDAPEDVNHQARKRYHRIFEKNDGEMIKQKCRRLLEDSGIDESIKELLKKDFIEVRKELAVYSDLSLQTSLLRVFLSFHPAWLKAAIEAIFDTKFEGNPKNLVGNITRFTVENVFSNPKMLKNKKFAQGSGKPIVTAEGKEALHRYFLLITMKLLFLIETAYGQKVISNLTRIFTKSSHFKTLDDVFSELTKELLSGRSASIKKAFSKIGFDTSYRQSFIENYDYQAKTFNDFNDGLILAKLVETIGEMEHGKVLSKLRDPAGDRIRKVNNVKIVLTEVQENLGIHLDEVVTAQNIVASKKESVLALLWSLIGVRVAKEKKFRMIRNRDVEHNDRSSTSRRRSAVHDDMSSEVLKICKVYGRELDIEVLDLDSLLDGKLLSAAWTFYVPGGTPVSSFEGATLWDKVVTMAEMEMRITRGLDQNVILFTKTYLERMQIVRKYSEKVLVIQKAWRAYLDKKKTPKLYSIVQQVLSVRSSIAPSERSISPRYSIQNSTFTIPRTPVLKERPSLSQFSERHSMDSTFNDATFTVGRDSIDFKIPKTPARVTFAKKIGDVIEEEEDENEETIVPSTAKKRTVSIGIENKVFNEEEDNESQDQIEQEKDTERDIRATQEDVEIPSNSKNVESEEFVDNEEHNAQTNISGNEDMSNLSQVQENSEIVQTPIQENSEILENTIPEFEDVAVQKTINETEATVYENQENHSEYLERSLPIEEVEVPNEFEVDDHQKNVDNVETLVTSNLKTEEVESNENSQPEVDEIQKSEDVDSEHSEDDQASLDNQLQNIENMVSAFQKSQQAFVEDNNLVIEMGKVNDNENPELIRILRETRILKKKQQEIARKLGKIEQNALAAKSMHEHAFVETPDSTENRSNAGQDSTVFYEETDVVEVFVETSSEVVQKNQEKIQSDAALIIQKMVRGFLARRRWCTEIQNMRERITMYHQVLANEDMQFEGVVEKTSKEDSVTATTTTSVEKKLRKAALHGLTNANLHMVLLGATIIDRITDLVPSLLNNFVMDLNGVKLVYDILAVADRGYAYTSILHPVLSILQKSFVRVPDDVSHDVIKPLLPGLSPRLLHLMLAHSGNKAFFMPITTSLIAIARRFEDKKTSGLDKYQYSVEKALRTVKDSACKKAVETLQIACSAL